MHPELENIVRIYQDLVLLELNKLRREGSGYDFSSPDSFLNEEELRKYVSDEAVLNMLKRRELLVYYGNGRYRTAHVDLIWRIINLRAYPDTPPRALEFTISYSREPISSFKDHSITELENVRVVNPRRREALGIVIKALKDIYPGISHFQLIVMRKLLTMNRESHIGVIAPTASGKTLTFMLPILVRAVEKAIEGSKGTVAILTYPRKALAKDQIEKILELIVKVNKELSRRYGRHRRDKQVTIGLDYGDIKRFPPLEEDEPLLNMRCPEASCEGVLMLSRTGLVYCNNNKQHVFDFIYGYKEAVWERRPHIYVTNVWTLYQRLLNAKTIKAIKSAVYVVFDESHVYAGYLGGHVHYVIMLLKKLLRRNRPIFVYSSATIPHPDLFIKSLSGESHVDIFNHDEMMRRYYECNNRTPRYKLNIRVYLLPNPGQSVETLTEESIIPVTLWCFKHGLKAVTFIDSVAEVSTIYDYINKTILGTREGKEVLDHIFKYGNHEDKINSLNSYSWITLLPAELRWETRDAVKEWILSKLKGSIGIHYGALPKDERSRIEEDFKKGYFRTLIATSTLELGIDIGDVAVVIQHKLPRDSGEFIQRSGRAGRSEECFRTSLSFINLQNSPIATLYFFDENLRKRLERIESHEPLRIGLKSENILTQHLISLLMHECALKRNLNFTVERPRNVEELLRMIEALYEELRNLDSYASSLGLIMNDIYFRAKENVVRFIKLARDVVEYVVTSSKIFNSKTKSIKEEKIARVLREILYNIRSHKKEVNKQLEFLRRVIRDRADELNQCGISRESLLDIIDAINAFIDDFMNNVYRPLLLSVQLGRVEMLNELKSKCRNLLEDVLHKCERIEEAINEFVMRLRRNLIYNASNYYKCMRTTGKISSKLKNISNYPNDLYNELARLHEVLESSDDCTLAVVSAGIPRYAREFIRFLTHYKNEYRKLPSTLRIIEELSQIIGLFKLSALLEQPSMKISLRETIYGTTFLEED